MVKFEGAIDFHVAVEAVNNTDISMDSDLEAFSHYPADLASRH